jgi:hypothetical protein
MVPPVESTTTCPSISERCLAWEPLGLVEVVEELVAELLALLELVAELELDAVEDASEVFSAEVEEEVVVGVAEASSLSS